MIDDKALLNEYLSESEELLDQLLADLDSIGPAKSDPLDRGLVNRMFRTVHSLKGLSGMMGLPEVQAITHEFEDLLDDLRLDQLSLNRRTSAALQEAGAGLAAVVSGAARGSVIEEDFDKIRELLRVVFAGSRRVKIKDMRVLESLELSEKERQLLTEYEEQRIVESLSSGLSLYAVKIDFRVDTLDSQYRSLVFRLAEAGELVATLPGGTSATETTDTVSMKLLLATKLRAGEVKRILAPFGGGLERLSTSAWRRAETALRVVARKEKPNPPAQEMRERDPGALYSRLSQESLRPLSPSVRVDLAQIDELSGLAHEIAIETQRLSWMADKYLSAAGFGARERFDLRISARRLKREFLELEERLVELRMVSLAQTFTRAARLAGRLARELGKSVSVEISGRETRLDKMIVDRIADPIYHILRNAIDHGIELPKDRKAEGKEPRGHIRLDASVEGNQVIIGITDDGVGIDPTDVRKRAVEIGAIRDNQPLSDHDTMRLIFHPGFSTAESVSALSGRGVGLDAVERTIHELGGEIHIFSEKGKGCRFELAVPSTLVMISAFLVKVGEWNYAINVGQIVELLYVARSELLGRDGKRSISWRGSSIPLVELRYLLGLGGARRLHAATEPATVSPPARIPFSGSGARIESGSAEREREFRVPIFITRSGDRHAAIGVEQFLEQREIIVKSLGALSRKIKGVVGAVDLEGGDVALVLDLGSLLMLRSVRL